MQCVNLWLYAVDTSASRWEANQVQDHMEALQQARDRELEMLLEELQASQTTAAQQLALAKEEALQSRREPNSPRGATAAQTRDTPARAKATQTKNKTCSRGYGRVQKSLRSFRLCHLLTGAHAKDKRRRQDQAWSRCRRRQHEAGADAEDKHEAKARADTDAGAREEEET